MPTYNHEPYIAKAIEGVVQQKTTFPVELIIGEDCSTDGTRAIVLDYEKKYPDLIRVIAFDENVGVVENSAQIREACRGSAYVAVCEGDDYWTDPLKLDKQVSFLEGHREYALCCHSVRVLCEGVARVKRWVEFDRETFSFEDIVNNHFIPSMSVMYRREAMPEWPNWTRECMSGDLVMELLVLDKGLGYFMLDVMGTKIDHPGGATRVAGRYEFLIPNVVSMYKHLNIFTEKRHQKVLFQRIAELSLPLATKNLKSGKPVKFLRFLLDSVRHDRGVLMQTRIAKSFARTLLFPFNRAPFCTRPAEVPMRDGTRSL